MRNIGPVAPRRSLRSVGTGNFAEGQNIEIGYSSVTWSYSFPTLTAFFRDRQLRYRTDN
jgi:hypothetical protein